MESQGLHEIYLGSDSIRYVRASLFPSSETKGRTVEDLDISFAKEVPARKFEGYEVDAFEGADPVDVTRKISEARML